MTTKEIAEVAGVSPDTAVRKIAELFPEKVGQGKRISLNHKESILVMGELRKKGFIELPQNAVELPQNAVDKTKSIEIAFSMMASAFDRIVKISELQESRLQKIENKIEERKALLPAPQIKPRDHINMIMRKYVSDTGVDHRSAYQELYREFKYRTHTDAVTSAKNRCMATIEYIEAEGMIETLESIAIDVFGR